MAYSSFLFMYLWNSWKISFISHSGSIDLVNLLYRFLMPNLNKKLVLKYYRWLVYIAVAFFVIQEISHIIIGYRPVFFLPFLEMYYEGSNSSSMAAIEVNSDRSASFFLEPSHFVQYIIPYYCISLSRYLKTKKIF